MTYAKPKRREPAPRALATNDHFTKSSPTPNHSDSQSPAQTSDWDLRILSHRHISESEANNFSLSLASPRPINTRLGEGEKAPDSFKATLEACLAKPGLRLPSAGALGMPSVPGFDAERVRVHLGPASTRLSTQIRALAFTSGSHIFFRDQSVPWRTSAGRALLIHELAHVAQQRATETPRVIQRRLEFRAGADQLTYRIYTPGEDERRSESLIRQFIDGARKYLGLDITPESAGGNITIKQATRDVSKEGYVDKKIRGLLRRGIWLIRTRPALIRDEDQLKEVTRRTLRLKDSWVTVRNHVETAITQSTSVQIATSEEKKAPAFTNKYLPGLIWLNPTSYQSMVVRAETGWDGFWILVHELLHPKLRYNDEGHAFEREVRRGGPDSPNTTKPTKRTMTEIGPIESMLNDIRIIFGAADSESKMDMSLDSSRESSHTLHLRTNYSDGDTIWFSPISAPRRQHGIAYGGGDDPDSRTSADYEYPGVALGSAGADAIATPTEAATRKEKEKGEGWKRRWILAWQRRLLAQPTPGVVGRRAATFTFSGDGVSDTPGGTMQLDVENRGEARVYFCTLDVNSDGKKLRIDVFADRAKTNQLGKLTAGKDPRDSDAENISLAITNFNRGFVTLSGDVDEPSTRQSFTWSLRNPERR